MAEGFTPTPLIPSAGFAFKESRMPRRNYLPTTHKRALALCKIVVKAQPIVAVAFPTNTALQAALSAALAACETLRVEVAKELEEGV